MLAHHDPSWSGGDWFAATYKLEVDPDPAIGAAPNLTGSVVDSFLDPTVGSVSITVQPRNATALAGNRTTFSTAATGTSAYGNTVFYQWQSSPKGSSTWTNIDGATGASYETPILGLADDGTQFRVITTVPPYSQASSVVTLTVVTDTIPPVVSVGAMPDEAVGVVHVGVGFNETVDEASGQRLSNYSVSPGTMRPSRRCRLPFMSGRSTRWRSGMLPIRQIRGRFSRSSATTVMTQRFSIRN
ncbi:MAG: hypothetical protein HY674_02770 [Chloroflexi bacterium]|nr:hypothetical protein [Chloroflexota bacterium]